MWLWPYSLLKMQDETFVLLLPRSLVLLNVFFFFPQYTHQHVTFLCNNRFFTTRNIPYLFLLRHNLHNLGVLFFLARCSDYDRQNSRSRSFQKLCKMVNQQNSVVLSQLKRPGSIMVQCVQSSLELCEEREQQTHSSPGRSEPLPLYILSSCSVEEVL